MNSETKFNNKGYTNTNKQVWLCESNYSINLFLDGSFEQQEATSVTIFNVGMTAIFKSPF